MTTVVLYTIPAYGHVNSILPLASRLCGEGYRVICYTTLEFREVVEAVGAEVRFYRLEERSVDLRDGSRLLRFYRLLLEVTADWVGELSAEARQVSAACILHDSAAHWGKRAAELSGLPAIAFCSLVAVNRWNNPSFFAYARNFSPVLWRDFAEVPRILQCRRSLRREYGFRGLGMLATIMNWEELNIISYAREMQVGGRGFDSRFFFLGPSAAVRGTGALYADTDLTSPTVDRVLEQSICYSEEIEKPVLSCAPEDGSSLVHGKKLLYVSLGTIFNTNLSFYRRLFCELGDSDYRVTIAVGKLREAFAPAEIPDNFILEGYADQRKLLSRATVFLTAGGMNSICEAVALGTPCLIFPQQGEQKISGQRLAELGFGLMYDPGKPILAQLMQTERLRTSWNRVLAQQITGVHMEELLVRIHKVIAPAL